MSGTVVITYKLITFFLFLQKLRVTSNGSRSIKKVKPFLNINITPKVLYYRNFKRRGRNTLGLIVCRTKSSVKRVIRLPKLNSHFRTRSVLYIVNFLILPYLNKLVSLVFYITGGFSFLQIPTNLTLFSFQYFKPLSSSLDNIFTTPLFFKLKSLKVMSRISLLATSPGAKIQYIKSSGCYGVLMRINLLTHLATVKLPSGVKKNFSIYLIVVLGGVGLSIKKKLTNTKAGFWKVFGKKSMVRGVAKNPVDHPHGGRTKSIKYPRTPWGKTTKFK